jgi:hypothetical protein
LKNRSPNQVFKDNDDQIARHLNDSAHNQQVYKTVPFKDGDKVRILEQKEKFDKGKQKFSKDVYTVDKKEGYKIIVNGTGKVISSLVRNAKMTPAEAKTAVATVNEPGGRGQRDKKKVVKMDL